MVSCLTRLACDGSVWFAPGMVEDQVDPIHVLVT